MFSSADYLVPNWHLVSGLDDISYVNAEDEHPARLIGVPKTLKTPRLIAIEPACNQYCQQALMASIVGKLEKSDNNVRFSDQTTNQLLALEGSANGVNATLDLKSASDLVANWLVLRFMESTPDLSEAIQACRSSYVQAEEIGKEPLFLRKFASMGSALCFPVEAMVFYTLSVLGILRARGLKVNHRNARLVRQDVHVYGDDIIVPSAHAPSVALTIEEFGLKVNSKKSFFKGDFRESCGLDAYKGVEITPVYVKKITGDNRRPMTLTDASTINQLYAKGLWRAAAYWESLFPKVPLVSSTFGGVGIHLPWRPNSYEVTRWNKVLHRFEVRARVAITKDVDDPMVGEFALQKFFLSKERLGIRDPEAPLLVTKDLERTVRSGTAVYKSRWMCPF